MRPFYAIENPATVSAVPCRGCGRPVYWMTNSETGKRMPFDTLVMSSDGGPADGKQGAPYPLRLDSNHWATCPNAAEFRRGRKGQ